MNIYVLKVDLKEAEYGGNRYIEPERTVLELASNDKTKFVQKVLDLFKENLLGGMDLSWYRPDINGEKVDGENRFEDLLKLLKLINKMMTWKSLGGMQQTGQSLQQLSLSML